MRIFFPRRSRRTEMLTSGRDAGVEHAKFLLCDLLGRHPQQIPPIATSGNDETMLGEDRMAGYCHGRAQLIGHSRPASLQRSRPCSLGGGGRSSAAGRSRTRTRVLPRQGSLSGDAYRTTGTGSINSGVPVPAIRCRPAATRFGGEPRRNLAVQQWPRSSPPARGIPFLISTFADCSATSAED